MVHSGFFDGVLQTASDFNRAIAGLISNGVLGLTATNLQVVENANMLINIKAGYAWIEGSHLYNDGAFTLTIATADGTLDRIDRVVARKNITDGVCELLIIKGALSDNPVAPALVRDGTFYDLGLAEIFVEAGTTEITQTMITDTRFDNTVCGQVYCLAKEIKTAELFAQYDAKLTQLIESMGESEHVDVIVNSDAVSIKGTPVSDVAPTLENYFLGYNPVTGKAEWQEMSTIPKVTELFNQTITFTPTVYTVNIDVSDYKGKYKKLIVSLTNSAPAAGVAPAICFGLNYGETDTVINMRSITGGNIGYTVTKSDVNNPALTSVGSAQLNYNNKIVEIENYGSCGNIELFGYGTQQSKGYYNSENGLNKLTIALSSTYTGSLDIHIEIKGVK